MWNSTGGFDNEGGFISSQNNQFGSPAGGAVKKERRAQNLVPVTIRQILQCTDENFSAYDKEVHCAHIVGLIKAVDASSTKISYTINDGTGSIQGIHYLANDSEEETVPLMENTYCKAAGSIRQNQGAWVLSIFSITPLMDLNRLTTHILEVIHARYKLKKIDKLTANGAPSNMNGGMANSFVGMDGGGMNTGASGGTTIHGLNPTQEKVYRIIQQYNNVNESGPSRSLICKELSGTLKPNVINDALEYLSGEGHIYSSIDDDHFRTTDS